MILSITDIGYLAIKAIIAYTPVNPLCKKGICKKMFLIIFVKKMAVLSEYISVYLVVADVTKYTLNP